MEPASSQSTQFSTGITEEQEIHAIEISSSSSPGSYNISDDVEPIRLESLTTASFPDEESGSSNEENATPESSLPKGDSISASLYCCNEPTEPPSIIQSCTPEILEPCIDIGNVLAPTKSLMKNAKQLMVCQMLKNTHMSLNMFHHQKFFLSPIHMGVIVNLTLVG